MIKSSAENGMDSKSLSGLKVFPCPSSPCTKGTPPLTKAQMMPLTAQLSSQWKITDAGHLEKKFKFPDFKHAHAFVNQVAELAEDQQHHPDIFLAWGRVKIMLWTHKINGLSENDFVLAAMIDQL